jgi:hypothetical protein
MFAKVVQTRGTTKKKRAFSLSLPSAAYLGAESAKLANEGNDKEKARFFSITPDAKIP